MQFTPKIESRIPLPENITKLAYEILQQGKSIFCLSHKTPRVQIFFEPLILVASRNKILPKTS